MACAARWPTCRPTREVRAGAAIAAPHGAARIGRAATGLRIGDDGAAGASRRASTSAGVARGPHRRWPATLCTIGRAA
jgi:hypothetical protein